MLAFAAVAIAFLVIFSFMQKGADDATKEQVTKRFDDVIEEEQSAITKYLLKAGKIFGGSPATTLDEESALYQKIRLELAAAGNMYGGFVEVFLATQVAALFLGAGGLVLVVFNQPSGALLFASIIGSLAVMVWPYSKVKENIKKRADAIGEALPEFAELLLMPLNSGYGIIPALGFTAERLDGPVAEEVRHLLDAIKYRTVPEAQAFEEAGEYLGTPASRSFFAVLAQAYLEGTRVAETLAGQAAQLRKTEYERLRERIGKLENTIAIMTGIHLLPGLFLIILFPAAVAVTGAI